MVQHTELSKELLNQFNAAKYHDLSDRLSMESLSHAVFEQSMDIWEIPSFDRLSMFRETDSQEEGY